MICISGQCRNGPNDSRVIALRFSQTASKCKKSADERAVLAVSFESHASGSKTVHTIKPILWLMKDNVKEVNTLNLEEVLNPSNHWLTSDILKVSVSVYQCVVSHITLAPQKCSDF